MGKRFQYNGPQTPGKHTRSEFIGKISAMVVRNCANTGILASVVIGQACEESGNGNDYKAFNYNNFFGHKAFDTWSGDGVRKGTGKAAYWRVYPSAEEAIKAHIANLRQGKFKLNGVALQKTPLKQLQALQKAGYNVGENRHVYAKHIYEDFILKSNLQQYDERMFALERQENENNLAFHEQDSITKALHNIFA